MEPISDRRLNVLLQQIRSGVRPRLTGLRITKDQMARLFAAVDSMTNADNVLESIDFVRELKSRVVPDRNDQNNWNPNLDEMPAGEAVWIAVEFLEGPKYYKQVASGYKLKPEGMFFYRDGSRITGKVVAWKEKETIPKFPTNL